MPSKTLSELAEQHGVEPAVAITELKLRIAVTVGLLVLFFLLNAAIVVMVWWSATREYAIANSLIPRANYTQIITPNVIMALVGSTVVQAGTAFLTIVKYLFPAKSSEQP